MKAISVFIGWSGAQSKQVALALSEWIPHVVQLADPWMSKLDIPLGARWLDELKEALTRAEYGIVCVTSENVSSPWIYYEVGFLDRVEEPRICPYLVDLDAPDGGGPLAQLQWGKADRDGTHDMLAAIANMAGLPAAVFEKAFDNNWKLLEDKLAGIREAAARSAASEPVAAKSLERGKEFLEALSRQQRTAPPLEEPGPAERPDPRPGPEAEAEAAWASLVDKEDFLKTLAKARRVPSLDFIIGDSSPSASLALNASLRLQVINPSRYSRAGYVATPWAPIYERTKIDPSKVVVVDKAGDPLPTQVDLGAADDPSRGTLLFMLKEAVPGRVEDEALPAYVVGLAESGGPRAGRDEPRATVEQKERSVKLANSRLEARVMLHPAPHDKTKNWYSGSVSSVLLDGKDLLSAFKVDPHDYEKRCMQVDQLHVGLPGEGARVEVPNKRLIYQPYQVVSTSSGPVRSSVTIASPQFECKFGEAGADRPASAKFRLHRKISLYRDETYLVERMFLQGLPAGAKGGWPGDPPLMEARFFTYADFGLDRYRANYRPEWLVMGAEWTPYPAYGFAADVDIDLFENPHPDFPEQENRHKTFSWVLKPARTVRCLHLFMLDKPSEARARVERAWYELISDPLDVELLPAEGGAT